MNIVIKADDQLLKEMQLYYANDIDLDSTIPHTKFVVNKKNLRVTAYQTNKVMFQGKDADNQARLWADQALSSKTNPTYNNDCLYATNCSEQIGSDEVGTGDYFGPVVVCATYLNQEIVNRIAHLNIQDSKNLSDPEIIKLASELKKIVPHYVYVLTNEKYNEAHKSNNQNQIKAKMHNYALAKVIDLIKKQPQVIVDQFCSPTNYFSYLADTKRVIKDITFETKAESKYLSVAVASIIARDIFLTEMDKLSLEVGTTLMKGSSNLVDFQGTTLVREYGFDILKAIAKVHFANTQKIIDNLE